MLLRVAPYQKQFLESMTIEQSLHIICCCIAKFEEGASDPRFFTVLQVGAATVTVFVSVNTDHM